MAEFILRYWLEVLFGAAAMGLTVAYRRLSKRVKKQDAVGLGVQALLRDRIIQTYNHYKEKGYCPIYGLDNVYQMYRQYQVLGGNGTITALVEELENMPRQEQEEKK